MDTLDSLRHSVWDYKHHVTLIPECRRNTRCRTLWPPLGEVFRKLAAQKASRIEDGHVRPAAAWMLTPYRRRGVKQRGRTICSD